jgi:hypothetical protein
MTAKFFSNSEKSDSKSSVSISDKEPKTLINASSDNPFKDIMYLQRTIGNRSVGQLFASGLLHTKQRIDERNAIYEKLLSLQMSSQDTDGVKRAAADGVSASDGQLPHLGSIQAAFGSHDVSNVQAHVGGAAGQACQAIGALAYATGNHVAFKESPDLHTAAHEAAHVVQQRAGVHLTGGVGQQGDAYEVNADAVADRVVQGRSAQDLLGSMSAPDAVVAAPVQRRAVQREVPSSGPEFEAEMERPMRYPPSWLCQEGIEFFRLAERGLERTEMRNVGRPITIVEPSGEQQNRVVAYLIGERSGERRYYATTQEQVVWASPTEIQCFRYYNTSVEDASAIARSHHDANLLMYRYVELEGMSPYNARDRIMGQDAALGRVVMTMCMVSGA